MGRIVMDVFQNMRRGEKGLRFRFVLPTAAANLDVARDERDEYKGGICQVGR